MYWPKRWGLQTSIMGILNITPDSFSDGGDFLFIDNALKKVEDFIAKGVDVIDIGAQSTRPGAIEVGSDIEKERLIPILRKVRNKFPNVLISVDTFNSDVAYESLKYGANWINDVTGGRRDNEILKVVSEFSCPFVITHSRGNSQNMNYLENYDNLLFEIIESLELLTDKALNNGIDQGKIIWDPGLGFSKDTSQNINILKNLDRFKSSGFPLLIGASRKRFIGEILNENNPKERDIGSLAISCLCSQLKVDMVRVHNVKMHREILKVADQLYR